MAQPTQGHVPSEREFSSVVSHVGPASAKLQRALSKKSVGTVETLQKDKNRIEKEEGEPLLQRNPSLSIMINRPCVF